MAQAYSIEKITFFGESDRVSSFHYDMFHGISERPGVPFPPAAYGRAGTGATIPLRIWRPGNFIPDICSPSQDFVVSEKIASELRKLPNLELLPVEFERLFQMRYAKGDFWWYQQDKAPEDPARYAKRAKDERAKFEPVPTFYEVLTYRHQDVVEKFSNLKSARFDTLSDDFEDEADVQLSEEMLREYPILWHLGFRIVSEKVFALFDPYLDRDFYFVSSVELT